MKTKLRWLFYWIIPYATFIYIAGWRGLLGIGLVTALFWGLAYLLFKDSRQARNIISILGVSCMVILGSIALAGTAISLNLPGALLLGGFLYPLGYALISFFIY